MHKCLSINAMYHIWQEPGAPRTGCQCSKTGFGNKSKKKKFRKLTLKHTNQIEKWTTCLVKRQRHSRGKGFLNTVYIVEQYGIFPTAMRPKPTEYNNKKKIIGG